MSLNIGIVGLPNVGKSTTFNALTKEQNAQVANYPFCTIQPNKAIVPVPDGRIHQLAHMVEVERAIPATIEFMDIAGLVKGASQGEGLGNQFLGNIRDADALIHVVRCFDDPNVVHVSPNPDPRADIEIINTELALADLQQLERKIEKLESQAKGDKKLRPVLEMARALQDYLGAGLPAPQFEQWADPMCQALNQEMRFLTAKPVIYAANVDEAGLETDNGYVQAARAVAAEQGAQIIKLCARLEEEMAGLTDEERHEYLALSGVAESGLEKIIRTGYGLLGLISYFTFNAEEVRAWTIRAGWTAPQAAGVIHTDFEKGFIRAEVVPFAVFAEYGGWTAVKSAGLLHIEGREYVVQDGDVIYFRFNV
ncbi:MAG: redox-regulated ATPase YchF [Ardenticatenaceae bacterium]|nr:redox-regulated ATPase YchF [Anaerolineales bacterium]MCB8920033.1 redox-regulated ATPase YchF [Ardenticatenaceae bacterium]MCB8989878.1 redox-regulated ATPase YchF [Ardenticatenaceae bacterium]MCB9005649.1 redox-regulated ATPase YchF [Ardenticatenaceae bacterium]